MAKPTTLLILALTGVGLVGLSRRKKRVNPTKKAGTAIVVFPVIDRPLCGRYPSGSWSNVHGNVKGQPRDNPGWTDDDAAVVKSATDRHTAEMPSFGDLKEARAISFDVTRAVVTELCPSMNAPDELYSVDNYRKASPGFTFLWDTVENLVWNRLTGGAGGGDN